MLRIVDYTFNLAKVTIFLIKKTKAAVKSKANIIPKTVFSEKDNPMVRGAINKISATEKTLYVIASVLNNFAFLKITAKPKRETKARINLSVRRMKTTRIVFISFILTS